MSASRLVVATALAALGCRSSSTPPPAPPVTQACSPAGAWRVADPRPPVLGSQDGRPLFITVDLRPWRDRYVADFDGRVNAVIAADYAASKLTIVLQDRAAAASLLDVQSGPPAPVRGTPAPPPDPDGPHAKPPTGLDSGVLALRDPSTVTCTLSQDCAHLACTFDGGTAFAMTR